MASRPEQILPDSGDQEVEILEKLAEQIPPLFTELLRRLDNDNSKKWEQEYRVRDLSQKVDQLKRQLEDDLLMGGGDIRSPKRGPQEVSALEVAQDQFEKDLRDEVRRLEKSLKSTIEELQNTRSQSWDLRYRCQDLNEEVWRLNMHLSHSVAVSDWEDGMTVPKTARERVLEQTVAGLRRKVADLEEVAWRKEERYRYKTGLCSSSRTRSL